MATLFYFYEGDDLYIFDLTPVSALLCNMSDEEITQIISEIVDELVDVFQETIDLKEEKITRQQVLKLIQQEVINPMHILIKNYLREQKRKKGQK